jgi:catechol 2,3-dioxygenase-like lactoylglutathione lyase family enzyme
MNHTALRVKDMKKAFQFYHETLRLPVVRTIGPEDNPRVVFLQGIELSRVRPEDAGGASFSHFGLEVDGIEEACDKLKKRGIAFEGPVRDIKFEEERKAVKVAFFRDPDGNRVELVEWRNL